MGNIQPLGSLVQPGNVVVEVKRLIVTSLHPTQHDALRQDLGQSSFVVTDCIVKMVGTRDEMRYLLQEDSGGEQTSSTSRNLTHLPSGDCQGGGHVSNCPDGGLYIESWSKQFGFDGSSGMVSVSRSLITLEVVEQWAASKASDIATGLRLHRDVVVSVSPVSVMMNLTCRDFGTPGSPLAVAINATVSGGEVGSARYVFNFNHMHDCIEVRSGHEVIIQGLEIQGAAGAGGLARMMPFFHVLPGATLILENLVVVVHNGAANNYSIQDLHDEIESITATDSSDGDLNITVVPFSKFWDDRMMVGNTKGVLVSGAAVGSHKTGEESSMAGIIRLKHTFFVREVDLPHHSIVIRPTNVTGSKAPNAPSASGTAWIGIFWGVGSFLVLVASVFAVLKFKMQQVQQQQSFCLHDGDTSTEPCESLGGGSAGGSSEATRTSSVSAKEVALQEHRSVPDKLLKALALGPLIGRGSFGHVYKATWNGALVAVKVIYHPPTTAAAKNDAEREAMLSSSLRHPNIVQTFLEATRDMVHKADDEELGTIEQHGADKYVKIKQVVDSRTPLLVKPPKPAVMHQRETWIVQEYCDRGTLGQAIQLQLLKRDGQVNMEAVVLTCLDICRGIQYLHSRNVVHGDLKTTNVLLCSSPALPRAFTAKVADFGLSRQLEMDATHVSTNTVGTLTHCPPELLRGRKLGTKADVYSMGIMMWEMVMGRSPFEGWSAPQLLKRVVLENWRPPFPASVLSGYATLAQECWETDPASRPNIDTVLERLEALMEVVKSMQ